MSITEPPQGDSVGAASGAPSNGTPSAARHGQESPSPVAIIGMGMRLPGAIHTAEELWQTLVQKRSTRCEIPANRFSVEGFHSPSSKPGFVAMSHGHFLADSDDLGRLDTSFFSMGLTEVSDIDPQQRMLLEVVYECMESSGQINWRGSNIACYVGVWGEDWLDLHAKDMYDSGTYRVSGGHDFAISNRISYEYDLKGPSFTVKAGCSSSLIALHEAVRAIQAGDCDGAIVAGTSLIFSPTMSIAMAEQGVVSPDASCKTFDAAANGYARGEAINAIFLKPLDIALKNGDPIRAVVRATSTNSDGKTPGMSMPSSESHETLIRRAYQEAGLDPTETVFVEAHGTGTSIGDPLEATAIARVFGGRADRPVYIGSIKPNLGHSEGASGVSSVMKAVLSLEHKAIPPNINFSTPNPKIPFREANMDVPRDLLPWPESQPLRVSVNSFGIGGANAHCIVESLEQYLGDNAVSGRICTPPLHRNGAEGHGINGTSGTNGTNGINGTASLPPSRPINSGEHAHSDSVIPLTAVNDISNVHHAGNKADKAVNAPNDTRISNGTSQPGKVLYVLSAANAASLRQSLVEHQKYLQDHTVQATDVSYTLCNRREHLQYRSYSVTSTLPPESEPFPALEFSPLIKGSSTAPEVIMVFTGQGAHWAGMARELICTYASFRASIAGMGRVLSQLEHPPVWDLVEELSKPEELSNVGRAEFSQPLVCAVQVALTDLLRSWGVFPAAVVGHSSGEMAAAYAAGAITAEEAITIAYYRGYVNKGCKRLGGMAAIGLGAQQVAPYLSQGVVVACENSPESVTLSGDKDVLDEVCKRIRQEEPGCFLRELKVQVAYHSHHMQDIGGFFESLLPPKLRSKAPAVPFFSSVKATKLQEPGCLGAAYWRENLESPVRFANAVKLLLDTRAASSKQVFVEIGPHSALAGPLRQAFKAHGNGQEAYASAMIRGQDCVESVLKLAGELFVQGVPVDFSRISPAGNVVTNLPTYSWNHDKEYWAESRLSKDWRFRKFPRHELLGSRTLESSSIQPEWRNVLRLQDVHWLRDHQVLNDVVFPFAGYLAMAVEAVRQADGPAEGEGGGFTLRDVVVQSALVVSEGKPVEILTTLRPVRLTNTLNSAWWEFSIVSHNGTAWMKHCDGQVRQSRDSHHSNMGKVARQHTYPRAVENLYPELQRFGLRYGPCFRGLENVSCQPNGSKASATLRETTASESSYAVHPTSIDHCLQLLIPASCGGVFYRAGKLGVPTGIGELYLNSSLSSRCEGALVETSAVTSSGGAISGTVTAISKEDGVVLLSLESVRFSPLEMDLGDSMDGVDSDFVAAARLDWKPDLDLADMHRLVRPSQASMQDGAELDLVERLTLLAMLEIQERAADTVTPVDEAALGHIHKFGAWIAAQIAQATKGEYQGLEPAAKEMASLDREARLALMEQLRYQVLQSNAASAAILIGRIVYRCEEIMQGLVEGIEVLQADDGLTNFYNYVESRTDSVDFFAAAGHTRPTLRVLEIGAGTGGGAQVVLEGLAKGGCPDRLYSTYAYTDISAGFFVAARERFKEYRGLDFRVLDITKDPVEQGFEAASFDLIIAGNVLHATPFLNGTLTNVRKLLAPDGYLFLQELSPKMRMVNLIMGILPGWWFGAAEGRTNEPYLAPEQWDKVLKEAGFSGVDAAIYDAPHPYHINANIISRLAVEAQPGISIMNSLRTSAGQSASPRLSLLHRPGDEASPSILRMRSVLVDGGFQADIVSLHQHQQVVSGGHDMIVSLLELETPFFESISGPDLGALQKIVASIGSTQMVWITRPAQEGLGAASSPGFGLSLGLTRTLRSEQSLAITTVEMDRIDDDMALAAVARLLKKLLPENSEHRKAASAIDPDREFVLVDGVVKVARYHPVSLSQEMAAKAPEPEAVKLEIGRMGLLQTLGWVSFPPREPASDEVVVEPRCAGLNFRDVLLCMGIVEAKDVGIGLEGSGVVTKVGTAVTNLQPGDRIFYLADNCFSTQMTISAQRCAKIPPSLPWEQAATMPCVYSTVIHSLLDIGGLRSGQSVLIHSACGGIGIAALNICKNIPGLEVYVTVGNDEKVKYVMSTFGLPRENIFNSRDTSFLHGVRAATGGRGVDLVLNSLSGELLHASWQCVAPYGKMLEIGKRDFIGKARLEMDLFEANRSFIGIDLARFDSARCHGLLQRTANMLVSGVIKPIEPIKVFSAAEVEAGFRYMQKGTHLGKIVVTIPEAGLGLPQTPRPPQAELNPSASYLLVGGLGGLGRAVATWMVEKGARHLLFMSRSAGQSARDQAFFRELLCQGCIAQAVQGSVTDLADVERAVASAPPDKPIRGVLQMSMVLRDKPFADMDLEDWETAVKPKVQGTWNLHLAAPKDLDFFFATGSISGSFGTPGQANYAAGNTYLTALFQHRRALGLPASILHIGLVEDIGYLAQNPTRAEALRAAGGFFLRTRQLLDGLNWALISSSHLGDCSDYQLTIGLRCEKPLSDPANRVIWRKDARMAMYHNHEVSSRGAGADGESDDSLRLFLASVEAEPDLLDDPGSLELVTREIGARVYMFMLRPAEEADPAASLSSLGVDSLVTIEIRNWIKRNFGGVELSTLEILNSGTIEGLGRLTVDTLKARIAATQKTNGDAYLEMKAP